MDEFLDLIAPYNLWNGNSLPMGFERRSYTDRLMKYTGNRLIKVLTGQRRVGKSYIMRQIAMELIDNGIPRENTLFINRELAAFDFIRRASDLNGLVDAYRRKFRPEGRIFIFIDEVQEIEAWERAINSMSQDYTVEIEISYPAQTPGSCRANSHRSFPDAMWNSPSFHSHFPNMPESTTFQRTARLICAI